GRARCARRRSPVCILHASRVFPAQPVLAMGGAVPFPPRPASMSEGIAILPSGGDAAGMNPAIKCAAEYAAQKGYKPWLVYDGLRGLIDDKIVEADRSLMSGILHRGGTFLRSSRSKRFFEIEYRRQAF